MSQETRRRQNEFLAARGATVPAVGNELDPVPRVNYEMPPLHDDMFYGFDDSAFHYATGPFSDEDEEGEDAEITRDDPSHTHAPSADF